MKYIDNFYNKCTTTGVPINTRGSDNGETPDEDYVMCQVNNGSSILMFNEKNDESQRMPSHFNPGSLMDDDFCYSVDKKSKKRNMSNNS